MPTLVAMAPSGETFISSTPDRGYWLHVPFGERGAGPIDESMVEEAIVLHGFVRVGADLDTWEELEQAVDARTAPPLEIQVDTLDAVDVDEMLQVARRWAAQGEGDRSRRLRMKLLEVPTVRSNDYLYDAVLTELDSLESAEAPAGLRLSDVPGAAE